VREGVVAAEPKEPTVQDMQVNGRKIFVGQVVFGFHYNGSARVDHPAAITERVRWVVCTEGGGRQFLYACPVPGKVSAGKYAARIAPCHARSLISAPAAGSMSQASGKAKRVKAFFIPEIVLRRVNAPLNAEHRPSQIREPPYVAKHSLFASSLFRSPACCAFTFSP
jgi:hypothetical protein